LPTYTIIVRQYFSPKEVGIRIGIVLMTALFGMALGGWMSGIIFDYTRSYQAAFLNGLIWNVVNAVIVLWLMLQPTPDWLPVATGVVMQLVRRVK
jgi:MFS family permease